MPQILVPWQEWAVDQQNYVFAANQALHNFFLVWFTATPWFLWLLVGEKRCGAPQPGPEVAQFISRFMDRQACLTFWMLCLLMATGANFGALDLFLYGKLRDVGIVPICALGVKVCLATISLAILFYLWKILGPQLQVRREVQAKGSAERYQVLLQRRERLWRVLMVLGPIILAAAAVLRFTS